MKTRIKNLREDHDLTQKQLSKLLSVSQVAYSYYELNRRNVPLDILFRLADFYNTSIDYLLYRTDEYMPTLDLLKQLTILELIFLSNKK